MTITRRNILKAMVAAPAVAAVGCMPQDGSAPSTTIDPVANFPFNGARFRYLDNQSAGSKITLAAGMNVSSIVAAVASDARSFSTLVSDKAVAVTGFGADLNPVATPVPGFKTKDGTKLALVQSAWGQTEANGTISGLFVANPSTETSLGSYYWSKTNGTVVAEAHTPVDGTMFFLDDKNNLVALNPSTNPTGYKSVDANGSQVAQFKMTDANNLHFQGALTGLPTNGVAMQAPNGSISVLTLA